jgi:hypothetical protein
MPSQAEFQEVADIFGQRVIRRAREDLPAVVLARPLRLLLAERSLIGNRSLFNTSPIGRRHDWRNYASFRRCIHRINTPLHLVWLYAGF